MTHNEHAGERNAFVLEYGANFPLKILILQPFFEEANRLRQILVSVMRELERHEIGSILADLPGTGESVVPGRDITLDQWRTAIADLVTRQGAKPALVASFRGAALIDDAASADHVWRFAPETGARLVRDLRRTQLTSAADPAPAGLETVAGNLVRTEFLDQLAGLSPTASPSLRVVRIESDAATADIKIKGTSVWRRSEPGDDAELRAGIVTDLVEWARVCAAS